MTLKPIILIGLMGAGKTITGKLLAQQLAIPFCDTDDLITEKEQMSVSSLFEIKGEPYFRQCETDCLHAQDWQKPFVMSTGGGLFVAPVNRGYLLEKAFVIWLNVPLALLKKRLLPETEKRPLLQNEDWPSKLEQLAQAREETYKQAHWTCNVSDEPVAQVVQKIMDQLNVVE